MDSSTWANPVCHFKGLETSQNMFDIGNKKAAEFGVENQIDFVQDFVDSIPTNSDKAKKPINGKSINNR